MQRNEELARSISTCTLCPLHEKRKHAVPALPGPRYHRGGLSFVVAIPRNLEDRVGEPLVPAPERFGRLTGGVMLNQAFEMAGVERDTVLLMNRVRCKPPRNRIQDYPEAIANCEPWNVAELEAYDPGLVVLMGNVSMKTVFGAQAKISAMRGTFRSTGPEFDWGARVWTATFDPVAAAQTPALLIDIANDIRQAVEVWKEGRF